MAVRVLMPVLSPTMEKGHLVRWCKNEGDGISIGDVLFEIETDKAVMEVEALEEGTLYKVLVGGRTDDVPVNTVVAILREKKDTEATLEHALSDVGSTAMPHQVSQKSGPTEEKKPTKACALPSACAQGSAHASESKGESESRSSDGKRQAVSPLARVIAEKAEVDLRRISGSGPGGRVIKKDVEAYIEAMAEGSGYGCSGGGIKGSPCAHDRSFTDHGISAMRRTIANVLTVSKQTVPHFYLSIECRMEALLSARASINAGFPEEKISVTDMIAKACALALWDVRALNSSWEESVIREYHSVDLAIATAIEGGILTPVLRAAHKRSVRDLSRELKGLVGRARDGKLQPQEFTGGTFTLSNLGMFGVERFSAIIPSGQAGILAIGATLAKPVVSTQGTLEVGKTMVATLAADHRLVDGAQGASFLSAFQKYVENPVLVLA